MEYVELVFGIESDTFLCPFCGEDLTARAERMEPGENILGLVLDHFYYAGEYIGLCSLGYPTIDITNNN